MEDNAIKFKASLWKVSRDHQDEVTIVLKVPSSDAITVIGLPTQVCFEVSIEKEKL